MFTPEIAQIMAQLKEIDKSIEYLFNQTKALKEENERLKNNQPSN